jgi:glycosyltransferase involved in cell wall biosynthesis
MIDISVVVPARNRARTLPYCLDSLVAQTLSPREIIVVDDHSTDDTERVVRSYQHRGVRHLQLADGHGAQAARNAGVRASRAPWIAFQDSDDRWMPNKLERQALALGRSAFSEDVLVHTDGVKVDLEGHQGERLEASGFEGDCYGRLLTRAGPLFPGMLVHKRRLEDIGLLDTECPAYQEWDTAIRLAKHCRLVHVSEILFEWVRHDGETISSDRRRDLRGHEYVLNKHREEIQRVHGIGGWQIALCDLVWQAITFGEHETAQRLAREHLPSVAAGAAGVFMKARVTPRGGRRLLKLLARISRDRPTEMQA